MKKPITYIFFLTILSSFLILSCQIATSNYKDGIVKKISVKEKTCIEETIAIDNSYGEVRNHACEDISLSETITNYVIAMDTYNFENCPKKFADAFKNHQTAWNEMLHIADKYPHLRGEMHDLFNIIEEGDHAEEFTALLKTIWVTWAEVERVIK